MRGKNHEGAARAQDLRAALTPAERSLWHRVRARRLCGYKFVRQSQVGPYFADFLCREAKLVVELDGSQHVESPRDDRRDTYLVQQGYQVLRFWNDDVNRGIDSVCETIVAAIDGRLEPHARYKVPDPGKRTQLT